MVLGPWGLKSVGETRRGISICLQVAKMGARWPIQTNDSFFCFWGVWVWLVECGQAIDRQTLAHVRPPFVTISPNFWAGTPPPPFQYTVPFIRGQGGSYAVRGSPLRPFSRVLLCPRNIPKLRSCMGLVVVWIWASLIIAFLFLGSMGVACRVWASNQSTNFAACPATCCYKKPELLGWDPPRPPRVSITDFNIICGAISHKKFRGSFGGYGGPRQKARLFVTEGIMAKKAQIQ